jgi:UDP-N-acetyl-D-mannosaminuronate dehydrogenase
MLNLLLFEYVLIKDSGRLELIKSGAQQLNDLNRYLMTLEIAGDKKQSVDILILHSDHFRYKFVSLTRIDNELDQIIIIDRLLIFASNNSLASNQIARLLFH